MAIQQINPPSMSEVTANLVYNIIWNMYAKKSFISGLWLRSFIGTPLYPNLFMNVLSPVKYPFFQWYYKNLLLATPGESALHHQGSEEEKIRYALTLEQESRGKVTAEWDKVKAIERELLAEYTKYFPSTKGMLINYAYSPQEVARIVGMLNKKFLAQAG